MEPLPESSKKVLFTDDNIDYDRSIKSKLITRKDGK